MTKKLLFGLAFALLMSVGCNTTANTTTATEADATETTESAAKGGIVYINMDSLISGYQHYLDLKANFDTKTEKIQKELDTKSRAFERKVTDYQNKVQKGLITRATAAETEQNLATEQQQVIQYRDQALAELQEEEQVLINNINNDIRVFIDKFNAENSYDLIISSSSMTNTVLIGKPELDITTTVLNGMNADYATRTDK